MAGNISFLSLAAAALYSVVALAAMAACGTAASSGQPNWNRNVWLWLAVLFVVLIVMRGLGIEDLVRDAIRDAMRGDGTYAERRQVQGIVMSIALALAAAGGFWWLRRTTRNLRGRRNVATVAALAAGGGMLVLVVLRMISLHMIDRALYGPLKLNWVGDIGTSLIVLGAAIYYVKLVRARP